MKRIVFAAFMIGLSVVATAQTGKKDTALEPPPQPPPPPMVTVVKFAPPRIVKDHSPVDKKPFQKVPKRVPPPPPPEPVVERDTVRQ